MDMTRKGFLGGAAAMFAAAGCQTVGKETPKDGGKVIQGFDEKNAGKLAGAPYVPFSEKKVRVGIAGEGFCSFGSAFAYQVRIDYIVINEVF